MLSSLALNNKEHNIDNLVNSIDYIEIKTEGKSTIGIDKMRDVVLPFMSVYPNSSDYKIAVINEADKLTEQAQNALLKSIEEPKINCIYFLIANNISQMLPTIQSRCNIIYLQPWNNDQIKSFFTRNSVNENEISDILFFSNGSIEQAISYYNNRDFFESNKNKVLRILNVTTYNEALKITNDLKKEENSSQELIIKTCVEIIDSALKSTLSLDNDYDYYNSMMLKNLEGKNTTALLKLLDDFNTIKKMRLNQVSWQSCLDLILNYIFEGNNG